MGTVGSELALGCDGWIIRCLNGGPPLLRSGLDRVGGGQWVLWNVVASFC
jgi:hypothetical protein